LSVLFRHHAEAAVVIPHRPADGILLQRRANIGNPRRAILRIRRLAIDAKLVASYRHIPALGPGGHLADLAVDELVEMGSIDEKKAAELIMDARKHWFAEEAKV